MTHFVRIRIVRWYIPSLLLLSHSGRLEFCLLRFGSSVLRIICPPISTIEGLGSTVRALARRQLSRRLADGLTDRQRRALDQLLEVRSGGGQSTLAWLRQTAYAGTTGNFPRLIERLNQVHALDIESARAARVHQNYWLKLAREGGQGTVQPGRA